MKSEHAAADLNDPLHWLENQGRTLLNIANSSIDSGLLKGSDIENMRHLQRETPEVIKEIQRWIYNISQMNYTFAHEMGYYLSKLVSNALLIGLIAPASSASAKAAIEADRARRARAGKAQSARSKARDEAVRNALPADWSGQDPWALAGRIKGKINSDLQKGGFDGIGQQSIYQRLRKIQGSTRS